jgi:hypothetical protein
MQRELAFRPDCDSKSKETLTYERNSFKKKYKETNDALGHMTAAYWGAVGFMKEQAAATVKATGGTVPAVVDAFWAVYVKYSERRDVFSKHSTGHKTHRGMGRKPDREHPDGFVMVDAHLTIHGDYYKPWKEGDEPSYYMETLKIGPENFALQADGTLKPIKKY